MKHIFFSILTGLAFFGCQPSETTKKRSLDCYVRYLVPEAQIHAEAILRQGDSDTSLLPMQAPNGVLYQGKEMELLTMPNIRYRLDLPGKFMPQHSFAWEDEKGRQHKFEMRISPIQDFGFGTKTLSRQQPATFRWEGEPLQKGETMVFLWENTALRKTAPMEIVNIGSAPVVEFPAAKLSQLPPGEWTLYLVRKKLTNATVNGVEVSGIIEYYTHNDTIQLK